jgi:hypothetical protein
VANFITAPVGRVALAANSIDAFAALLANGRFLFVVMVTIGAGVIEQDEIIAA